MKKTNNYQNKCMSFDISPSQKDVSNDVNSTKSLNFNEEEHAAFNKLFSSKTDDERRVRIRELMNATKKKEREGRKEL